MFSKLRPAIVPFRFFSSVLSEICFTKVSALIKLDRSLPLPLLAFNLPDTYQPLLLAVPHFGVNNIRLACWPLCSDCSLLPPIIPFVNI